MIKKLLHIICSVCLILFIVACDNNNNSEPQPKAKRTIAIYMIATNSLSSCDVNDIEEIETYIKQYGTSGCRLLVYWVSKYNAPQLMEITKEKRIIHKSYSDNIKSTTIERMEEVFYDISTTAPADDYGLILWSHASGWASSLTGRSIISSLDFGEDYGSTMPIDELAKALPDNMFSFIYADACYMSGIEVVYELRNKTKYFIGSATELPADGMDYTNNLKCFFDDNVDLIQCCKNTFNKYNSLSDASRTCTIALTDCSKLDSLATLCKNIHSNENKDVNFYSIQRYKYTSPYLFYDFTQYTKLLATDEQKLALDKLMEEVVPYKAATPYIFNQFAINSENYSGLSSYIFGSSSATSKNETYYQKLAWYKDVIK